MQAELLSIINQESIASYAASGKGGLGVKWPFLLPAFDNELIKFGDDGYPLVKSNSQSQKCRDVVLRSFCEPPTTSWGVDALYHSCQAMLKWFSLDKKAPSIVMTLENVFYAACTTGDGETIEKYFNLFRCASIVGLFDWTKLIILSSQYDRLEVDTDGYEAYLQRAAAAGCQIALLKLSPPSASGLFESSAALFKSRRRKIQQCCELELAKDFPFYSARNNAVRLLTEDCQFTYSRLLSLNAAEAPSCLVGSAAVTLDLIQSKLVISAGTHQIYDRASAFQWCRQGGIDLVNGGKRLELLCDFEPLDLDYLNALLNGSRLQSETYEPFLCALDERWFEDDKLLFSLLSLDPSLFDQKYATHLNTCLDLPITLAQFQQMSNHFVRHGELLLPESAKSRCSIM